MQHEADTGAWARLRAAALAQPAPRRMSAPRAPAISATAPGHLPAPPRRAGVRERGPAWLAVIPVLALAAACNTPSVLLDPRTEQVHIGPDVFHVLVDGDTAIIANFSTGTNLMLRVEEGARDAAEQVSGCRVTTMVKNEAINRWQARLRCP